VISSKLTLKTGVSVIHCSNGHVQIPNLGINVPTVFFGIAYRPNPFPAKFEKKEIAVPESKIHFNVRLGIGVHELARTTEPVGTAKYAIYVTDFICRSGLERSVMCMQALRLIITTVITGILYRMIFLQVIKDSKLPLLLCFLDTSL
jgi:hypothetical protein